MSELWEWDAHAGCIRLQGLACVHPEVAMVGAPTSRFPGFFPPPPLSPPP